MYFRHYKNIINKAFVKVDRTLLSRLIRRFKVVQSYKSGIANLKYPPEYLQIDIIGYCNLKCKMCPQGIEGGVPYKGIMDFSLYKKVVDNAVDAGVFSVLLVLRGEPLLHKQLIEMIHYAKSKGLRVIISTNCTLLTASMSEALIKSGLDEIILSFDTANKALYEDYRQGAMFNDVLNNILTFLEIRKKMKSRKPFPVMQNLQMFNSEKPNNPQIERDFYELFSKYDIWIIPKYFNNWSGIMKDKREMYEEARISPSSQYQVCFTVYQRIVVSWDGKVLSCCNDFQHRQIMGDVTHQSIADVWNSPAFIDLRQKLVDRQYQKLPLCKVCGALWK